MADNSEHPVLLYYYHGMSHSAVVWYCTAGRGLVISTRNIMEMDVVVGSQEEDWHEERERDRERKRTKEQTRTTDRQKVSSE